MFSGVALNVLPPGVAVMAIRLSPVIDGKRAVTLPF